MHERKSFGLGDGYAIAFSNACGCASHSSVQSRNQTISDILNKLENSDIPMRVLPIPDGKNESFRWVRLIDIVDVIESLRTQGSRDP